MEILYPQKNNIRIKKIIRQTTKLLLIVLVSSCYNKQDTTKLTSSKIIHVNEAKNYKLSNIIESVEYIQLETTEPNIGKVDKFEIIGDKIYLLDCDVTNALYIYNLNGEFQFKIAGLGVGPEELSSVDDFLINLKNKKIIISDQKQNTINYFNFNGEFISKRKLLYASESFTNFDNKDIYYVSNYEEIPNIKKNLIILDGQDHVNSAIDFDNEIDFRRFNFSQYDSSLNFLHAFDNNIYNIKNDSIKISYHIDFGTNSFSKNISNIDDFSKARNSGNYFLVRELKENENFVVFKYHKNNKIHLAIYDKTNYSIINGTISDNINIGFSSYKYDIKGNDIFVINNLSNVKDNLLKIDSTYLTKTKLNQNNTTRITNSNDNDEQIIVLKLNNIKL
jgi:hypothetical protein